MQNSSRKSPELLRSEETKRTTIILEKQEREFIESLIREGKEPGIKPLISKLLEIYRSLMMQDWRFPGEYYCGISRLAFVNVELINLLTQEVPKERWHEIGARMGEALKISIQSTLGIEANKSDNWDGVFERLKVQGLGDCHRKDKFLLLKSPIISDCEMWRGLLEGLLGVELETRNRVAPLVFEIKKRKQATV